MPPDEYLSKRLDPQIIWYDDRSNQCQKYYNRLQAIGIILAALIPLFAGYANVHFLIPVIISIFGTVIVITSALSKLGGYYEKWIQYRKTCELLKHEKYLFLTNTTPYGGKPYQLLVERVESIISAENINWSQLLATSKNQN